jgi:NAD-dependent deacetylase
MSKRRLEKLVVLSGAGVSAESGLKTFRDGGGLWEGHRVEDVATPEAFERNPGLVLEFYNQRRRALASAAPNPAHLAIAELEHKFEVSVITQNVDNLHERAGSSSVLHLHGELTKARSSVDPSYVVEIEGTELVLGDRCPLGSQLRPHIVWFGEAVPLMEEAMQLMRRAEVVIVVGTSLVVYPAAGLVEYAPRSAKKYVVDVVCPRVPGIEGFQPLELPASKGLPLLVKQLLCDS